jgi:hypothetical protein
VARPHARPPPRHVACRCPYDARAPWPRMRDLHAPARTASRRLYSTHDTSTPAAARAPDCSTMYSTVPSVAARDRVRPVCVVSRLWPRPPRPARLQRTDHLNRTHVIRVTKIRTYPHIRCIVRILQLRRSLKPQATSPSGRPARASLVAPHPTRQSNIRPSITHPTEGNGRQRRPF